MRGTTTNPSRRGPDARSPDSELTTFPRASDPRAPRVYWAYKSQAGSAGLFDKIICYDYVLEKASLIVQSGEYLATLARPGLTLESLDSISGLIDALTFSLDDVATSALSQLSIFDSSHKLGFFGGPIAGGSNLEATLTTPDQTLDRRMRVKGFRPIVDAQACWGSIGTRELIADTITYSTEHGLNAKGFIPANVSTRIARGKIRIPAGTVWSFASGIEPMVAQEGKR